MLDPTVHVPVLCNEVVEWCGLKPGMTWIDGTLGGGGHAREIFRRIAPHGRLIGIDRDPAAIARFEEAWYRNKPEEADRLPRTQLQVAQGSYLELPEILSQLELAEVDGILLDLGLSSDQLADPERGFAIRLGGPLDLRFDPDSGQSAAEILGWIGEKDLADLIFKYGEERHSRRIARVIIERRRVNPIQTSQQLADLVHQCVPGGRIPGRIDSATKTFQALRIAVNEELHHLEKALEVLPKLLRPGSGRMIVISFHSLEDRLVKNAFREHPMLEALTRKPVTASEREKMINPRARSARMRVAVRRPT